MKARWSYSISTNATLSGVMRAGMFGGRGINVSCCQLPINAINKPIMALLMHEPAMSS